MDIISIVALFCLAGTDDTFLIIAVFDLALLLGLERN